MRLLPVIAFAFLVSGCAGIDKAMTGSAAMPTNEERQEKVASMNLTPEQKEKFVSGQPWIGMSESDLKAMWNNEPARKQKKLTAKGNEEIQLYQLRVGDWKTGIQSKYYKVTLLDGKVAELKELERIGSHVESLDAL